MVVLYRNLNKIISGNCVTLTNEQYGTTVQVH